MYIARIELPLVEILNHYISSNLEFFTCRNCQLKIICDNIDFILSVCMTNYKWQNI